MTWHGARGGAVERWAALLWVHPMQTKTFRHALRKRQRQRHGHRQTEAQIPTYAGRSRDSRSEGDVGCGEVVEDQRGAALDGGLLRSAGDVHKTSSAGKGLCKGHPRAACEPAQVLDEILIVIDRSEAQHLDCFPEPRPVEWSVGAEFLIPVFEARIVESVEASQRILEAWRVRVAGA